MAEDYPRIERSARKGFGQVLSEGFSFFGKNWITLILPIAIFFILAIIVAQLLSLNLNWQSTLLEPQLNMILQKDPSEINSNDLNTMMSYLAVIFSIGLIDSMSRSIINVLALCLIGNFLYQKFLGKEVKLGEEVKKAINGKMILVILLLGLGTSLGMVLLYIPSIIIIGFYSFSIFTYNNEELGYSIKSARSISKGSFWKVFGTFIIYNLIIGAINMFYQFIVGNFLIFNSSWLNPATLNIGMIILYYIIANLPEIMLAPLFICLLTSLYVHLKDKTTLAQQQYSFGISRNEPTYSVPVEDGKGIYCPFCGKFMHQHFQYCPNCGKELTFN